MRKNRIMIYWVLLILILFLTMLVLATGRSQARYNNTVTTMAIMQRPVKGITSNCLVTAEEAGRTILLGEIEDEEVMTVPFWLLSAATDQTCKLNWGVSDPMYADYLNIAVKSGNDTLKAGEEIELLEDVRLNMELCLVPTEIAFGTSHEEIKINVHVTLGDTMWGTFQVILPAVEIIVEEPPEEELPVVEEPPVVEESVPNDESSESNESAEASEPSESGETTESGEFTESSESTESGESTESTETTESSESVASSESTEPSDPIETEPEPEFVDTVSALNTIQSFDITQQLPVMMTLADHITSVKLGIQRDVEETAPEGEAPGEEAEEIVLETFPDYTMFSVDGGTNYYMVYGDFVPEFVLHEVTTVPLLLDFRYTNLEQDAELTIAMEAYFGNQLQKACTVDTVANVDCKSVLFGENAEATIMQNMPGTVLNFENTLEFALPMEWKGAEVGYSVECLTMTDNHILQYVPVELSDDRLQATYRDEDNIHSLELRLGKKFTQPGTYRINIFWSYEGLCYNMIQKTFFVNCLGRE